jgi:hypothetical protein
MAVVLAGLLILPLGWLASLAVPRHGYFSTRAGNLREVVAGEWLPQAGNFSSQSVRLTTDTGLSVDLRVMRPEEAAGPLPLVLLLGGHRTGRDAVDAVGEPGPMIVAALDYPYHGPERLSGVWQSVRSVPAMQRGLLDTPPAVSVALDWLIAQPWVDPARVELMGLSLGVPFAAVAGALDPRFRRVWLIHGQAGNRAWLANRLEGAISNRPLREFAAGVVLLLAHGASFRTDDWIGRIAPRSVIVVGATEDRQMTRAAVEQLYAAAGEPRELLWSTGGHVGPRRREIVQQLLEMVRSRLEPAAAGLEPGSTGP